MERKTQKGEKMTDDKGAGEWPGDRYIQAIAANSFTAGYKSAEAEAYNAGLERAAEIADLVVKDADFRGTSDVTAAGRISAARKISKQIRKEKITTGAIK
jgi:hypothetical protein